MLVFIVEFAIILSILILVHEAGHFFAAKKAGVWVEEFGLGIPPRLFGKKIGETIYSINLLPFGGFVRLHGETYEKKLSKPDRAFSEKGPLSKSLIITSGVIMNFILGIVAFSIVYTYTGIPQTIETKDVQVVDVAQESPASAAGLKAGDIIREIDGARIETTQALIDKVEENKGKTVSILVQRDSGEETIEVTPRQNPPEGQGALGVGISNTKLEYYKPPIWQRPFLGIYYGIKEALFWGATIMLGLFHIIRNLFGGQVPKDVAGPVGLLVITSKVAQMGMVSLINWLGVISVNLAILNIVPFPALDGGRLLFVAVEKFFGKRAIEKVEAWVNIIGMIVLVVLILAISFREVILVRNLGFSGYINYLTQGQGVQ